MKSGESSDNNRAFWKRFDAAAKIFLWTFFSSPLSNLILKLCGKGGFGPYKACLNWEKWAIINFSIQTNADISSNFLVDSDKFSRSDNLILIWRKNGERRVRNQNQKITPKSNFGLRALPQKRNTFNSFWNSKVTRKTRARSIYLFDGRLSGRNV